MANTAKPLAQHSGWWLGIYAVLAVLGLGIVYVLVSQNAEQRLERTAYNQLAQLSSQFDATLARYDYLAELIAHSEEVQRFFKQKENKTSKSEVNQLNQYLSQTNHIAATSDIYVMQADGATIAASNWEKSYSFIGQNFSFRPYVQQALRGQDARYYALGTTSGERGYYFSSPIRLKQQIVGVVAIKIAMDALEASWSHASMDFIVTDPDGIIFIASQAQWRLHALNPLTPEQRKRIQQSRRYANNPLAPFDLFQLKPEQLQQIVHTPQVDYLVLYQNMLDTAGWNVYLLADRTGTQRTIGWALLVTVLIEILALMLIYVVSQHQQQRRSYELQIREQLEAKVAERTFELQRTQEELVQAAKMAALGQLSAGINHELNNPLTAIRAYADNGVQFLDMGHIEIVRTNLLEIVSLTERMATITRQLKTFSRKSVGQIERCDVYWALDSALAILKPKFNQLAVQVIQPARTQTCYALADLVWFEQILVNLLHNAAEAVQEQPLKRIYLSMDCAGEQVVIKVADTGQGIAPESMPHVFEAFFTTKSIGKGLGLGLAISYRLAKDMNGHLSAENSPDGGAVFTLQLPQAELD